MNTKKTVLGGVAILIWLMLAACAGYYSDYGYYDYPYYDDYGYRYFVYPYGQHHHESGEGHREFGHRPEWSEHQGGGERHGGGEHHDGGEHHR